MRNIIALLTFTISMAAYAGSGDMGGGRALTIPNSSIEAVVSKDGVYARLIDIQEGFENFKGLKVDKNKAILDLSSPAKLDVESIILNDGTELFMRVMRASGGDMGGG